LSESVRLAPSCSNNQPWQFVFVYEPSLLIEMQAALSSGNRWAHKASLIIAVFSKEEDDCLIRDRKYHQFDTGIGVGILLLRATELGLVAHPIAGFSPKKTREILGIPDEYQVITLIIVGRHAEALDPSLSENQRAKEKNRPIRKPMEEFVYLNRFTQVK
jgi:nitroreductase